MNVTGLVAWPEYNNTVYGTRVQQYSITEASSPSVKITELKNDQLRSSFGLMMKITRAAVDRNS